MQSSLERVYLVHQYYLMSIHQLITSPFLGLQLLQVTISLAQHPNCERELEVWIRDRNRPVEHPLDRFLRP